jgi:hypothetical protein
MPSGYGTRTYAQVYASVCVCERERERERGGERERGSEQEGEARAAAGRETRRERYVARVYAREIANASVRVGRGRRRGAGRRGSYINKHRTATEDGRELLIKGRVQ